MRVTVTHILANEIQMAIPHSLAADFSATGNVSGFCFCGKLLA
jgi:hypothetical protein